MSDLRNLRVVQYWIMNSKGLLKGFSSTQDSRLGEFFLQRVLISPKFAQKCPKTLDLACVVIKIRESLQFQFKFGGIHFSGLP